MMRPMLLIKTLKHIFLFSAIILIGCTPPLDYFGNNPDMEKDRIFLSKMRKYENDKDKYLLIFVEQMGNPTKQTNKKKKRTLERYIELIKSFYGYTDYEILEERSRGFISPRYYVSIKFN